MADRPKHVYRLGKRLHEMASPPESDGDRALHRREIEPWLSAILESEHVSLLIGSGLTIAVASTLGVDALDMKTKEFHSPHADRVQGRAAEIAKQMGRTSPNIEDQFRAVLELLSGLRIIEDAALPSWEEELASALDTFARSVLEGERNIRGAFEKPDDSTTTGQHLDSLTAFFLTFASRSPVRDRLNIFTTNYDRLIEFACDVAGIWKLDRFVGGLTPRFRSSRLDVDIHYNPPGIRGEPRYLEGVVRLTKLHGSIDWAYRNGVLERAAMPFGCDDSLLSDRGEQSLIIYPNAAKDAETGEFPYAELFRDFSAATVRPNSVLLTYGYGFGDDHINRVLVDMLSIPSTHLVIFAYEDGDGRIAHFLERVGREAQTSLFLGPHFADLTELVSWYLPRPALDQIAWRETQLLRRRGSLAHADPDDGEEDNADADSGSS